MPFPPSSAPPPSLPSPPIHLSLNRARQSFRIRQMLRSDGCRADHKNLSRNLWNSGGQFNRKKIAPKMAPKTAPKIASIFTKMAVHTGVLFKTGFRCHFRCDFRCHFFLLNWAPWLAEAGQNFLTTWHQLICSNLL